MSCVVSGGERDAVLIQVVAIVSTSINNWPQHSPSNTPTFPIPPFSPTKMLSSRRYRHEHGSLPIPSTSIVSSSSFKPVPALSAPLSFSAHEAIYGEHRSKDAGKGSAGEHSYSRIASSQPTGLTGCIAGRSDG